MSRPSGRPLAVVVPAYNEVGRLPALLDLLEGRGAELFPPAGFTLAELIVVDDGSTDGTADLVRSRRRSNFALRLIRLDENRGKGAAVRTGMLAAEAPFALLSDADMATPFDNLGRLAAVFQPTCDIAIGSRGLPNSEIVVHQPAYRETMGKGFNVALRLLTRLPFRDTQCGFKLFRLATTRVLFEAQRIDGFAYDAEILVLARRFGLRIVEVPVRWFNDPDTTVRLVSASSRMALDLLRVAALARRPVRAHELPRRERPATADRST